MIRKSKGPLLFLFLSCLTFCDQRSVSVTVDPTIAATLPQYSLGVGITRQNSVLNGTAFFAPESGYLLTNTHVVSNKNIQYYVTSNGSDFFPVTVKRSDPELDLALLVYESEELLDLQKKLPFYAENNNISFGQPVVAIGSAFGLHRTFLQGIVSHPKRAGLIGQPTNIHYVQVQGVTYSGMSGAPVFDFEGRLIGVNRAAYGYSATTGTGLVIPAKVALDWAEE